MRRWHVDLAISEKKATRRSAIILAQDLRRQEYDTVQCRDR
jgi:hypothetical protein